MGIKIILKGWIMRSMKRRELTDYEKQCAKKLKAIWAQKKKRYRLTQEDIRQALGFSTQGAVSKYINGIIPLNTDAKIKFAKYLECKVSDFDPEFSEFDFLNNKQHQLIDAFERLPEPVQEKLFELARQLAADNEEQSP